MEKILCKICRNEFEAEESGLQEWDEARQKWVEIDANVCGNCAVDKELFT